MITRRALVIAAAIAPGLAHRAIADGQASVENVVVTGFRGTAPGDPEVDAVRRYLEGGEIAGVILLRRNIASPEQMIKLSLSLREAAGSFVPIISVDQEGGAVARLDSSNGFTDWVSAAEAAFLFEAEQDLFDYYLPRARELAAVGINLNFGPVLDLNLNSLNPIIGRLDRSFGRDPEKVVRCARAFVQAHREIGVQTCGKHFPGHGSSVTDSHYEPTDVNGTWKEEELVPFREMARTGDLDSVMTGHLVHRRFSGASGLPASLSGIALEQLTGEVGFSGPVFTDDMQMGGITRQFSEESACVGAVASGNTFLIYANHSSEHDVGTATRINRALETALTDGRIAKQIWQARVSKAQEFLRQLS